ncbi:NAD-dependent alcohol dehydrogenase [Skeletonema marinoi]|uniref:NAD-dependent alcohol dehydrogenase n=1 Tax=Skeletonema marinoi TaxID=267567 RepID=A0AAD9DHI9_9STRA|nr:NAD-dependent alcohol dehydrogenase [Skeletonema marinoi]
MNALTTLIVVIYYTVYTVSGASGWIARSHSWHHFAKSILHVPRGGDVIGETPIDDDDAPLVIIIDVDNCLYSEQELLSSLGEGVESQIVRNTHLFGLLHFNLTSEDCDELYKKYGSTIEGLRHTLPSHLVEETMRKFYSEVYDPIDFGCLLGIRAGIVKNENDSKSIRSGYDHGHALQKRRALAELLESISNRHPVYLASNSPKAHIMRVLNNMGLRDIKLAGILSPDAEGDGSPASVYPTKSSPRQYYQQILSQHSPQSKRIILLDDSSYNIRQASTVGIHGIHVNGKDRTLEEGLAEAFGHILPNGNTPMSPTQSMSQYMFSDVKYLGAKNKVDANAIDTSVWETLAQELSLRLQQKKNGTLRVADLGAGMLSMLELFMNGGGENERSKASMFNLIRNIFGSSGNSDEQLTELEYFAYESNTNLLDGCKEKLWKLGFEEVTSNNWQLSLPNMKATVHLLPKDFQNEQHPPESLDLIMGCCFADLFEPDQLVLSLGRFAHKSSHPPLVYLPITFAGGTRFSSTHPFAENEESNQLVPSDTTAFQMYARSLINHGHNLDPSRIVNAICNFGGSLIAKGSSDWIIDPKSNQYLWETMLYFFGMSGASEITKNGFDAAGWIRRSRREPRTIIASNVDLLFHLAHSSSAEKSDMYSAGGNEDSCSSSRVAVKEIQFVSPYNVTSVNKELDRKNLGPDQIEVESLCSLVSSGTELKIFKGTFESASLDVNIKGMADEAMEYPLAYGYSLVGRVVACGSNVADAESLIGRNVFTFSPHSSRVVVDRDAVQIVPDGIEAEDAIFMPSVETALSLVHDAHVRLGENVAVYGQGLIGLLVTAILSMHHSTTISSSKQFCSVTAFDALDDRLAMSSKMGATSALQPQTAGIAGPFDVCIEVSGNPRALQSAIDNTSNNGRIIVGSWYGNTDVALKLGIDFHRSHKTIQTSQVSTIPSTMTGLWNKDRRFALTWALVRSLQPSRLISKRMTLTDVQEAYELLDGGKEIAICFKYNK